MCPIVIVSPAGNGLCALCREALCAKYAVLDRVDATSGSTDDKTRVICEHCDRDVQTQRAIR